ncbi:MAG TPA: GNAT family N-acetyltransferase [Limnochordia bacterium]|nr:GNAT family N-acetyltransferase [Limnochordia bacterium]
MAPRYVMRAADAPKVVRFLDEAWGDYALEMLAGLPARTDAIDAFAVCAEADGLLVGAAVAKIDGGVAELEELIVAPDWRGRGVGRELLQRFEARSRELGCHKARVRTLSMGPQERFYLKAGYHVEARFPNDFMGLDWVWLGRFFSAEQGPREQ